MASWEIEFTAVGTEEKARIELIDTIGPINDWKCTTAKAFEPDHGKFTNQSKTVVAYPVLSWQLKNIDIDDLQVGSSGDGEVFDSGGTFSNSIVRWEVIKQL